MSRVAADPAFLERLCAAITLLEEVVADRALLVGSLHLPGTYLSLARGDSTGALRQFEAIPDTLCMAGNCFSEKVAVARLLAARGEHRKAAELLDRWAGVQKNTPSAVLAALERARIAERLGDRAKALERDGFVANVWRRADPKLRPYVEEATARLRRLNTERGR